MMDQTPLSGLTIRPATRDDAAHMVDLVDIAGHGLPMATWASMAGPGEEPRLIGMLRARRDTGGFSWVNARMAVVGGRVAGMAMFWPLPAAPVPPDTVPPLARPLQELENLCPGLTYINALAVYPAWRGRGIGGALLGHAGQGGPACLITGAGNGAALALYARAGFAEIARRKAVGDAVWQPPWTDWVLLRRV